ASNANYASTMIAEGPAVKMFQAQQQFFAAEFTRLWQWVMSDALAAGLLPGAFFGRIAPHWCFPGLVTRDRPRERHVDTRMGQAGILSRAEIARREGLDPDVIRREIESESPPPREPAPQLTIPCHAHVPHVAP